MLSLLVTIRRERECLKATLQTEKQQLQQVIKDKQTVENALADLQAKGDIDEVLRREEAVKQTLTTTQERVHALEASEATLQTATADMAMKVSELQTELQASQTSLQTSQQNCSALQKQVEEHTQMNNTLKEQLTAMQTQLSQLQAQYKQYVSSHPTIPAKELESTKKRPVGVAGVAGTPSVIGKGGKLMKPMATGTGKSAAPMTIAAMASAVAAATAASSSSSSATTPVPTPVPAPIASTLPSQSNVMMKTEGAGGGVSTPLASTGMTNGRVKKGKKLMRTSSSQVGQTGQTGQPRPSTQPAKETQSTQPALSEAITPTTQPEETKPSSTPTPTPTPTPIQPAFTTPFTFASDATTNHTTPALLPTSTPSLFNFTSASTGGATMKSPFAATTARLETPNPFLKRPAEGTSQSPEKRRSFSMVDNTTSSMPSFEGTNTSIGLPTTGGLFQTSIATITSLNPSILPAAAALATKVPIPLPVSTSTSTSTPAVEGETTQAKPVKKQKSKGGFSPSFQS